MDLGQTTIGEHARKYFPVVGTIFFFVLVSNLMSLIPGLRGSTVDVNVTAAWAIISFVVYNFVGIKHPRLEVHLPVHGPVVLESEIGGQVTTTCDCSRPSSCLSRSCFTSRAS